MLIRWPYSLIVSLCLLASGHVHSQEWWKTQSNPFGQQDPVTEVAQNRGTQIEQWWRTQANPWGQTNITSQTDVSVSEDYNYPNVFTSSQNPDGQMSENYEVTQHRENAVTPPGQTVSCACVEFYQCDDMGFIKTNGVGLMDIRTRVSGHSADLIYDVDTCPLSDENNPMTCCKLPGGQMAHMAQYPEVMPPRAHDVTPAGEPVNCMCVPFYQCDEKTGHIKTSGAGLLEVRTRLSTDPDVFHDLNTVCPSQDPNNPMICCKLPVPQNPPITSPLDPRPLVPDDPPPVIDMPPPYNYTPKRCGTRKGHTAASYAFRISGGEEASFGEFPWMLAILGHNKSAGDDAIDTFQCGASLIHPQVALTGAHCIEGGISYTVRAGDHDTLNADEELPHQDRKVTTILMHDNYDPVTLYNDVALLVLESPFYPDENVGTICLPLDIDMFDQQTCVATGWGRAKSVGRSPNSRKLKMVDLAVTPHEICQKELRTTRLGSFFILNPSFICAKGSGNRDTCSGDGGGPLACPSVDDTNRYALAGVVAWGIGCGTGIPAVYANVASSRNWIDKMLTERGFAPNENL